MDDVIRKGDLVMIVKDNGCPCSKSLSMGKVFIVSRLCAHARHTCSCGAQLSYGGTSAYSDDLPYGYDTRRLKKIQPPSLETETEREEEMQ